MADAKGTCSVCDENVSLRKDGLVRAHGYLKTGEIGPRVSCAGSDQSPRTGTDGAFSAVCETIGCEGYTKAIVWSQQGMWVSLCGKHARKALL